MQILNTIYNAKIILTFLTARYNNGTPEIKKKQDEGQWMQ
jgi:hypothetical protein